MKDDLKNAKARKHEVQRKRNEDRQKELESDAAKQKLELCAKKIGSCRSRTACACLM